MAGTDRNFLDFEDLYDLYMRASEFGASDVITLKNNPSDNGVSGNYVPCRWFYRNKSEEYFEEILTRRRGMMKTELKDPSGDPRSPINGRVSGMFFMASVERGSRTGEPMRKSPFGPCRLLVPVEDLLNVATNLYFTDFYCMPTSSYHYVTLVLTVPGSAADVFCAQFLLDLRVHSNPFLFMDKSGQLHVTTKDHLLVEVFYTEDLDIRNYKRKSNIPLVGKGSSTPGGLSKSRCCTVCNL